MRSRAATTRRRTAARCVSPVGCHSQNSEYTTARNIRVGAHRLRTTSVLHQRVYALR
jgi:hypothetical protein